MITVIRSYFKHGSQIVLWVIMAAFVIGLAPSFLKQMMPGGGQWAIRVNGQEIDYRDFLFEMNKQRQRIMALRMQYGEYADWLLSTMGMNDPKSMAFRTLVKEELVNQFGEKIKISLNPEYIINQMNNPQFVQEELGSVMPPQIVDSLGGINQQLLRQYLQYAGITSQMFERQIERALMDKMVRDVMQASFYLPEFDIKQKYQSEYGKKSFSLLTISASQVGSQVRKGRPSAKELEQFFEEQNAKMKRYWVPEKRSATIWTFDPYKYGISISDEQIESYYEKNKLKEFIDQPAKIQVRRILFRVPTEADRASVQDRIGRLRDEILPDSSRFAEFAKQYSQDSASASNGGILPEFERGAHEYIFDKTAFLLQKDGEVSSVIETRDGYEMLQRVSRTQQTFKPLASVRKEIKNMLVAKKFKDAFDADMKRVVDADSSNDVLNQFVTEKGANSEKRTGIVRDDTELAQRVYGLQEGQIGFFVQDDKGMMVKLTGIEQPHLPPFDTLKEAVREDYFEDKTDKQLAQRVQEARDTFSRGNSSFEDIAKQYGGSVTQTGWIDPSDKDQLALFEKKNIPLAKMLQIEKEGVVITHNDSQGVYLIRLDQISPINQEEYLSKRAELMDSFRAHREGQFMEGFVASLQRNATIETNESLVTMQE